MFTAKQPVAKDIGCERCDESGWVDCNCKGEYCEKCWGDGFYQCETCDGEGAI